MVPRGGAEGGERADVEGVAGGGEGARSTMDQPGGSGYNQPTLGGQPLRAKLTCTDKTSSAGGKGEVSHDGTIVPERVCIVGVRAFSLVHGLG